VSKLPITVFIVSRNGMPMLEDSMKSVDFCEQMIFVDDSSTDGSWKVAKRLGWECYKWYGSDSMAERRNYAIGLEETEEFTPEYYSNERMSLNVPSVRHDWTLYIDADELVRHEEGKEFIKEEFKRVLDTGGTLDASALLLINVRTDGSGKIQTSAPLLRFFRTGTLWFRGKIQHRVEHGSRLDKRGLNVKLLHYGYGDQERQKLKFLNRLPDLQIDSHDNPDELSRKRYVLNNSCAIATNMKHVRENLDIFNRYVEQFMETKKGVDHQMLLSGCLRHVWDMCLGHRLFKVFSGMIEKLIEYVDWVPDMHYYRCICAAELDKDISECGNDYFRSIDDVMAGNHPSVESESLGKKHVVAKLMSDYFFDKDRDKSKEWDLKYREFV